VLGSVNFLAMVLSLRLILLIAVIGAIGLTGWLLGSKDVVTYVPLAVYCGAVILPLVWLAARK
jgi:hypothetical protein